MALKKEADGNADNIADMKKMSTAFFLILMGMLVFFMQTGFALLSAGSIGASSVVNILLKNLADALIGILAWWSIGYALAYGADADDFSGDKYYFLEGAAIDDYPSFFFQWTFAATAATIVSGAMAGRTHIVGYLVYSFLLTGFVYPTIVHWTWSDHAWLTEGQGNGDGAGYTDFAGSGIVHACGGTAALCGALIVGPRQNYKRETSKYDMPGHSMPLVAIGTGILIFGFFAFNAGSVLSMESYDDAKIAALAMVNTIMAASGGSIAALAIQKFAFKNWSLMMLCNGSLAGMVSVCAGANQYYPWAALVIGTIGGCAFFAWSTMLNKLGIDDAIDAVGVHLGGGIWGVIAVPLFSFNHGKSIFYSGTTKVAWYILGWNIAGVLTIMVYTAAIMVPLFMFLKKIGYLRVDDEILSAGIDLMEHGEMAYVMDLPFQKYNWKFNKKFVSAILYVLQSYQFSCREPLPPC